MAVAPEPSHGHPELSRLLLECAPAAVALFDRDMRYLAVSRRWLADYRLTADVVGRSYYDTFPDIPDAWKAAHRRGLAGETFHSDGEWIERADGSRRWVKWEVVPWRTAAGDVGGIMIATEDLTDRRQAEEALRDREEQLELTIRHYPGMVARVDRDLRYVYVSPRYEEWFAVPPSALLGRAMAEVIGPEAYARAEPFARRALAGERVTFENQITLAAGRQWWVQVSFVPVTDGGGAVPGFFIFSIDVTERKQVEEALAEEREYAESIVETLHEPLLVLHPDLTVKGVNPAFYTHFRVNPAETVGRKIYQLGNGQWDIPALRTLLEDVLPTNKVFNDYEVTHEFEGLGRRVMLVNGRRLDHVQLILLGIRDITNRKRAEDMLREREERLRRVSDNADVGLTRLNRDRIYLSANPAYVRIAGKPLDQIVGRPMVEVLGDSGVETIRPYVDRVLRGERVTYETVVPFVGAGPRYLHISYSPDFELSGEIVGWVASVTDITERKRAEELLRRKMAALNRAEAIAHLGTYELDFKNADNDYWSDELYRILGRDPGSRPLGTERYIEEVVHPEDRTRVREEADRTLTHGEPFDCVYRIVRKDGSVRTVHDVGEPFGDDGNSVARLICAIHDITEQKEAAERQAFLLRFSDALRPLADPVAIQATTARMLGEHLGASRLGYAESDDGGETFVVRHQHTAGVPERAGRFRTADFGAGLAEYLRAGRRVLWANVADNPGLSAAEREAFAAADISAEAVIPLVKAGRLVAVVFVHFNRPHAWTPVEVALLEDVSERTWAAVERAKAEAALRASEERLRLAIRASNIGLWDWDLTTDTVVYSPEWKAQLGYAEGEVRDAFDEWESRLHPDDRGPTLDCLRRAIASAESAYEVEFRLRHKDGSWRWIFTRAEVIRDARGVAVRLLGCHIDVTERRTAEEALGEREARLAAVLNTAADAIVTIDRNGVVESVNEATERIFGFTQAELVGRNVSVLISPTHREWHNGHLARYLTTGESGVIGVARELIARRKDGTEFPIELSVSEIDHLRQFTGIVRDISVRKKLEREVVEIASLEQRRIGQDLHDDVGQQLTALGLLADGLVQSLRTESPGNAALAERIEQRVRTLLRQVRGIARGLAVGHVAPGELPRQLAEMAGRLSESGEVRVTFHGDPAPPPLTGLQATHLYHVAQEACTNALKHARPTAVTVSLRTAGGVVSVTVCDNGVGLGDAPEGLGMRIMRHRAALIGGRLSVTPARPRGTAVAGVLELEGADEYPQE